MAVISSQPEPIRSMLWAIMNTADDNLRVECSYKSYVREIQKVYVND